MVQAKLQRAEVTESRLYKGMSRMALAGYMVQSEYSDAPDCGGIACGRPGSRDDARIGRPLDAGYNVLKANAGE
jgi:hypothetical protein